MFRNLGGTAAEKALERARQTVERLRRDLGGSVRDAADRSRRALRGAGRLLASERFSRVRLRGGDGWRWRGFILRLLRPVLP